MPKRFVAIVSSSASAWLPRDAAVNATQTPSVVGTTQKIVSPTCAQGQAFRTPARVSRPHAYGAETHPVLHCTSENSFVSHALLPLCCPTGRRPAFYWDSKRDLLTFHVGIRTAQPARSYMPGISAVCIESGWNQKLCNQKWCSGNHEALLTAFLGLRVDRSTAVLTHVLA